MRRTPPPPPAAPRRWAGSSRCTSPRRRPARPARRCGCAWRQGGAQGGGDSWEGGHRGWEGRGRGETKQGDSGGGESERSARRDSNPNAWGHARHRGGGPHPCAPCAPLADLPTTSWGPDRSCAPHTASASAAPSACCSCCAAPAPPPLPRVVGDAARDGAPPRAGVRMRLSPAHGGPRGSQRTAARSIMWADGTASCSGSSGLWWPLLGSSTAARGGSSSRWSGPPSGPGACAAGRAGGPRATVGGRGRGGGSGEGPAGFERHSSGARAPRPPRAAASSTPVPGAAAAAPAPGSGASRPHPWDRTGPPPCSAPTRGRGWRSAWRAARPARAGARVRGVRRVCAAGGWGGDRGLAAKRARETFRRPPRPGARPRERPPPGAARAGRAIPRRRAPTAPPPRPRPPPAGRGPPARASGRMPGPGAAPRRALRRSKRGRGGTGRARSGGAWRGQSAGAAAPACATPPPMARAAAAGGAPARAGGVGGMPPWRGGAPPQPTPEPWPGAGSRCPAAPPRRGGARPPPSASPPRGGTLALTHTLSTRARLGAGGGGPAGVATARSARGVSGERAAPASQGPAPRPTGARPFTIGPESNRAPTPPKHTVPHPTRHARPPSRPPCAAPMYPARA
jgi:hypothetical protein